MCRLTDGSWDDRFIAPSHGRPERAPHPALQGGIKGAQYDETTLPGSPALRGGELHNSQINPSSARLR